MTGRQLKERIVPLVSAETHVSDTSLDPSPARGGLLPTARARRPTQSFPAEGPGLVSKA